MSLKPFDRRGMLAISRRNLPHWQQPGATYFITFRISGSLPAEVRERFEEMRRLNPPEAFTWMDRFLDAGTGPCPFAKPANAALMAETLRHFDGERYNLGAFSVMPNHVHSLVQPHAPFTLTKVVHAWKSFSAHVLQRSHAMEGRVWQEESFDRIVRNEDELNRFHQ